MDKNNRGVWRILWRTLIDIVVFDTVNNGVGMVEGIWIQWIHREQK